MGGLPCLILDRTEGSDTAQLSEAPATAKSNNELTEYAPSPTMNKSGMQQVTEKETKERNVASDYHF